jgi:transposase
MSDGQSETSQTSQPIEAATPPVTPAVEYKSPVRLRKPERSQVKMRIGCDDDLIAQGHQARVIWGVLEKMDLSAFCEPIQAREGVCGRNATDPLLLIALWLYAATRGVGSARELERLCGEDGSKPYQWLCGGVSINHHTLSDFRTDHAEALDDLFTQVIASLVDKGIVKVSRISQDGTRIRACAGASSFRGEERLNKLLEEAKAHVAELRALLADPEKSATLTARQKSARERAAREKQEKLEAAIAQLPELKEKQEAAAKKAGNGKYGKKLKEQKPRVSTTDPDARNMKMGDGGFRPAVNAQFAVDTESRAIVGVDVSGAGSDKNLAEPMRQQVEERTGQKVEEHLYDGGFVVLEEIDKAAEAGVAVYAPVPKPRDAAKAAAGTQFLPKRTDTPAQAAWRQRMGTEAAKEIYKQRASTVETVNADLKRHRGLVQFTVRGLKKAKCVALWCALAYNLMHFGASLMC